MTTTPNDPAVVAIVDQLATADRAAIDYVADAGGYTWGPDVGPVTTQLVNGMFDRIHQCHDEGRQIACPHLRAAIQWGIWFPWVPGAWLCIECATSLIDALRGGPATACSNCGATIDETTRHPVDVHIPTQVNDEFDQLGAALPVIAKLMYCGDCWRFDRAGEQPDAA